MIAGVGAALPERRITNHDLADRLDTTHDWIVKRTGIVERRHLAEGAALAELASSACTAALRDAGRSADEVDQVIVCTITPDLLTPGLAPDVARRVGAVNAGACDLNAACAGFVYALEQAVALVESGRAEVVLVCGAEALSRVTDHDDRATAVLFGDGAGAVVVSAGSRPSFVSGSDGQHALLLHAGAEERRIRMEGREVYRHAVARLVQATRAVLDESGLDADGVDLFIAHQANARIVEAAAAALELPVEKVALNVDRVANTSSASIPIALEQAQSEGRIGPGARLGLAAFGAGFVWAAAVIGFKEEVARAA